MKFALWQYKQYLYNTPMSATLPTTLLPPASSADPLPASAVSHFDLASLRAFCAVAREGSVSRAAARLHLTQPAVSLQIKALQERSQLQLFGRTPKGLALTRDGAALLPQAEKVLSALQDFGQSARNLRSTLRGTLRIGTILDPEFTRLGEFLKQLVESAPQIDTELRQAISGEVITQLHQGSLDVGFYLATSAELKMYLGKKNEQFSDVDIDKLAIKLIVKPLTQFTYRVLAPAGWGPQVTGRDWRALAALPWITTPPASAHHRLLAQVFEPLGIQPKSAALVDQEASMLDLVRSGVGLSLVRDSIAIHEAQSRGLVIADKVSLGCTLCFVVTAARSHELVIGAARKALDNVWG
jgi:DNA-binding transcriptional LysR family regulator